MVYRQHNRFFTAYLGKKIEEKFKKKGRPGLGWILRIVTTAITVATVICIGVYIAWHLIALTFAALSKVLSAVLV